VAQTPLDIQAGRRGVLAVPALAVVLALALGLPMPAKASELPERFDEQVVYSGLTEPTAVRFSPDGRVFVAEKSGVIKVFADLDDPTPTLFADLGEEVHNFWDRGLLGLALDPGFPAEPYLYVLYTYDPHWGDECPNPPGATGDGCVVSGRLSRLEALGDVMTGPEQVLIDDEWCQQYPSHSVGSLAFGSDGALYASAGDGASFDFADYGQDGDPLNPCGDPPGGVGEALTPPTAEGGALRSQDLRTGSDPTTLDGSILRLNPDTGEALPDNPGTGDANARRIVAYGFRNPFRFTIRPGTDELWVGDVGWIQREEINRLVDPAGAPVENFGWPCYEGPPLQGTYDALKLDLCEDLDDEGSASPPHHSYSHADRVVAGESCPFGTSAISGLAFYEGGVYPNDYDGALFFADHARKCIWAMREGPGGNPDPSDILTFAAAAANPVDLQIGPAGDLFYVDFNGGSVRRISYDPGNQAPTASATASVTSGFAPLEVEFDGTGSSDPDEDDSLDYGWDLDGDGQFDDSDAAQPSFTYDAGTYQARLRVADSQGASHTSDPIAISAEAPPALPRSCERDSPNILVGTRAGERLRGTASADAIVALGGSDVAVGLGGDDCLLGHSGRDRLLGGAGADLLKGGPGRDVLRGGAGRDVVRCGPGRDRVVAERRDRVARDCERVRRLM